jgi:hypothetical protein
MQKQAVSVEFYCVNVLEKVSWRTEKEDNSKLDLGNLGCEDEKYFDVTWDEVTSKYCTSSQPDFLRSSLLLSSPHLLSPPS